MIRIEQGLVVRDHLSGRAGVVEDLEHHLVAQKAAVRVHISSPQLVALLEVLPVRGEVSGQR